MPSTWRPPAKRTPCSARCSPTPAPTLKALTLTPTRPARSCTGWRRVASETLRLAMSASGSTPSWTKGRKLIDKKYLDASGNLLPLADLIREHKHDAGPVSLTPETKPHWFNSDGSAKPLKQIRDERAEVEFQAKRIAAEVRARTERKKTPEDKGVDSYNEQIQRHEDENRYRSPAQQRAGREYIDALKAKRDEIIAGVERAAKVKAFSDSSEVQLAREYASTYQRTLPPGCTPQDAAIMQALAARDGTDCTVAEFKTSFWQHVSEVEARVFAATEKIADEQRAAHAEATAKLAAAEQALLDSIARRQQKPDEADSPAPEAAPN